jgi:ABC-2 type transport system permease protein
MLAVARKDALDLILNPGTLAVLLIPILVALLFALLSSALSPDTARLLVYNPGGSAAEQVLSEGFPNAQITHARSAGEVQTAFQGDGSNPYAAGLVVPADFEISVLAGAPAQLAVYFNAQDVSSQQQQLLKRALSDYARNLAQPQAPVTLAASSVNAADAASDSMVPGPFYALLSVMTSFIVGASLMPNLLIEEKERKTLWMLLISPATMTDIVAGKLLVGLGYQTGLSLVTLAVQRAFTRQTPVIVLFILLGCCLTVAMGLLVGSIFRSVHVGGPFTGIIALLFLLPAFFAGPLGKIVAGSLLQQCIRLLPTYYLADGLLAALQDQATLQQVVTDGVVALGTALAFFAAAVWVLRRQTTVAVSA